MLVVERCLAVRPVVRCGGIGGSAVGVVKGCSVCVVLCSSVAVILTVAAAVVEKYCGGGVSKKVIRVAAVGPTGPRLSSRERWHPPMFIRAVSPVTRPVCG